LYKESHFLFIEVKFYILENQTRFAERPTERPFLYSAWIYYELEDNWASG